MAGLDPFFIVVHPVAFIRYPRRFYDISIIFPIIPRRNNPFNEIRIVALSCVPASGNFNPKPVAGRQSN